MVLDMILIFYSSVKKQLKEKVRKFGDLISTFGKVTGEKTDRGRPFLPPPSRLPTILNEVSLLLCFWTASSMVLFPPKVFCFFLMNSLLPTFSCTLQISALCKSRHVVNHCCNKCYNHFPYLDWMQNLSIFLPNTEENGTNIECGN